MAAEPEPEVTARLIPEPDGNAEPNGGANDFEILMPTALAIFLALTAVLFLSIKTQPLWWKSFKTATFQKNRSWSEKVTPHPPDQPGTLGDFLDEQSWVAVDDFKRFQNKPSGLLRVMTFPACSLALCPVTLYLYTPLMELFWPYGIPDVDDIDATINSIIYSFLIPSGLIYATTFGFAFHETTTKRRLTNERLSSFCGMVNSACRQIVHGCISDVDTQRALLSNLGTHTVLFMKRLAVPGKNIDVPTNDVLSEVICLLQDAQSAAVTSTTTTATMPRRKTRRYDTNTKSLIDIFSHVEELQNHVRAPVIKPLNVLQWLFLECLAFIAYFGILLVRAKSTTLELLMCFFTVFSISSFTYVLADMDCPFHGLFRVTLTPLVETLDCVHRQYVVVTDLQQRKMKATPLRVNHR